MPYLSGCSGTVAEEWHRAQMPWHHPSSHTRGRQYSDDVYSVESSLEASSKLRSVPITVLPIRQDW